MEPFHGKQSQTDHVPAATYHNHAGDQQEISPEVQLRIDLFHALHEAYMLNPGVCPKCGKLRVVCAIIPCGYHPASEPVKDERSNQYEARKKVIFKEVRTYGTFVCNRCGKPGVMFSANQKRHKECKQEYSPHSNGPRHG